MCKIHGIWHGLECFVAQLYRYLVWSILLARYVGYPLEQVRHISYQLSYAVKVHFRITTNNMCASELKEGLLIKWIGLPSWPNQYHQVTGIAILPKVNWMAGNESLKTRVHVISFHFALCCFLSTWILSDRLSCSAPHLVRTPHPSVCYWQPLLQHQRQLCINASSAGAQIFSEFPVTPYFHTVYLFTDRFLTNGTICIC